MALFLTKTSISEKIPSRHLFLASSYFAKEVALLLELLGGTDA